MQRRSTPFSSFSILTGIVLLAVLFITGCDTSGVAPPEDVPIERHGKLGVAYMPYGDSLLPPTRLEAAKTTARSAYGCYLAERELEPDAEWDVFNVYLHYPKAMVDAAGGEVQNVVHTLEDTAHNSNYKVANCHIPDSDGARSLLVELLDLPAASESKVTSSTSADDPYGLFSKRECHISESVCIRDSNTGLLRNCIYDVTCSGGVGTGSGDWGANFPSGGDSGSSPSGGGSGDDSGASEGTGCSSEHFQPVGSSCAPADDSEEEPEPVDEPVSKAEVASELIEACGLPAATDEDGELMSSIFEASVNATFNASSPPSHNFSDGFHQQYPDPLDGYSTAAFDMQDGTQLNLLTGIVETKFTEDPSSQISSGQSRGHIRALASTYDLIPPGATFTGAPVYTVVTNSPLPVEMIGRYSQGAGSYDLVTYANDRNVNFVHYRVMRTVFGTMKLEGDILGDAQTTRSAIQDFLGDFDVEFVIDCSPEN